MQFRIKDKRAVFVSVAKEFKVLEYLVKNISHKTFDNEDKTLILDGTKDFMGSFPEFLTLNEKEKKELIFEIIVFPSKKAQVFLNFLLF